MHGQPTGASEHYTPERREMGRALKAETEPRHRERTVSGISWALASFYYVMLYGCADDNLCLWFGSQIAV